MKVLGNLCWAVFPAKSGLNFFSTRSGNFMFHIVCLNPAIIIISFAFFIGKKRNISFPSSSWHWNTHTLPMVLMLTICISGSYFNPWMRCSLGRLLHSVHSVKRSTQLNPSNSDRAHLILDYCVVITSNLIKNKKTNKKRKKPSDLFGCAVRRMPLVLFIQLGSKQICCSGSYGANLAEASDDFFFLLFF